MYRVKWLFIVSEKSKVAMIVAGSFGVIGLIAVLGGYMVALWVVVAIVGAVLKRGN